MCAHGATFALIGLLGLAACAAHANERAGQGPDVASDRSEAGAAASFRVYALPALGLSFDVWADAEVWSTVARPDGSVASEPPGVDEGWLTQLAPPNVPADGDSGPRASLAVGWGEGLVERWHRGELSANAHERALGPEVSTSICGRAATRQEMHIAAWEGRAYFGEDQVRLPNGQTVVQHRAVGDPARVEVGVRFVHRGREHLAVWHVAESERARRRVDESRFFASIQCTEP